MEIPSAALLSQIRWMWTANKLSTSWGKKWLQKLESPPIFTAHVEGDLYEDLVFTIREEFFDNKNKNPHSSCYDQYYKIEMGAADACLFLRKKQLNCEPTWSPYSRSYRFDCLNQSVAEVISY